MNTLDGAPTRPKLVQTCGLILAIGLVGCSGSDAPTQSPATSGDQYWSVRTEPHQCGHVSISAHFNEWNRLGMSTGLMRESMLLVEALNGSGTVDFTYANVVVD